MRNFLYQAILKHELENDKAQLKVNEDWLLQSIYGQHESVDIPNSEEGEAQ